MSNTTAPFQGCITRLIAYNELIWPPTDIRRGWLPRFIFCGSTRRIAALHLLFWRALCGICMLIAALYAWGSSVDTNEAAFYLSYLTYQSLWINLTYFLTASILGIDAIRASSSTRHRLCKTFASRITAHRILSSLLAIAVSFTSVVVVIFWTLLYKLFTTEQKALYLTANIIVHGIVLLPPWIDLVVGATRLHFRTFIPVVIAAFLYLIINCIVSLTVHPVYSILTWRMSSDVIIVLGVFFVLFVAYMAAASIAVGVERAVEPGGRCKKWGADAGATFSIASLETAIGVEKGFKPCVAGCQPGVCDIDDEATDPLCERSHFSDDRAEHLCGLCCAIDGDSIERKVECIERKTEVIVETGKSKVVDIVIRTPET
jgi:hypothetical protein